MKNLLCFLFICCIRIPTFGQDFCQTISTSTNSLEAYSDASFMSSVPANFVVRVFIHNVGNDDGSLKRTNTEIQNALNILQNDYSPFGICISFAGSDEINSTNYGLHFSKSEIDNLNSISYVSNAINIYVLPRTSDFRGASSFQIPSTQIVIGADVFMYNTFNSHVLSHEFGHCLGLFHTFHGSIYEPTEGGECPELVNQSNCSTCGDFVCDTPADPCSHTSEMWCIYSGTYLDANGESFVPSVHNIMAYVKPNCMNNFTPLQGERMRAHLFSSPILQPVISPNYLFVQNKNFVSSNYYYSVSQIIFAGKEVLASGLIGDVNINNTAQVVFEAGKEIILKDGFTASVGNPNTFIARIEENQCGEIINKNDARLSFLTYTPMLQNENIWVVENNSFEGFVLTRNNIIGDTIIASKSYKKVLKHCMFESIGGPAGMNCGFDRISLVREDITDKKVFLYDTLQESEKTIYDFGMNLGDSILINSYYYTLIDTNSEFNNGNLFKVYTLENIPSGTINKWIEGIGIFDENYQSIFGEIGTPSTLVCFKQDGELKYQNININSIYCDTVNSIESDQNIILNSFQITPNPSSEFITLQLKNSIGQASIEIYNIEGRLFLSQSYDDRVPNHIDVSMLADGLYFLNIKNEKYNLSQKFLVNK